MISATSGVAVSHTSATVSNSYKIPIALESFIVFGVSALSLILLLLFHKFAQTQLPDHI